MTKLLHPINQDNFIFLLTWATSRVGCSFLADTYIFRAGSAKNGCSIVEERLLSAIKEDGAKDPRKKTEYQRQYRHYIRGLENTSDHKK